MDNIETRLSRLENLVLAINSKLDRIYLYQNADTASERIGIANNAKSISENDGGICDVADLSDVNSQAIDDLAEMVDELANQITKLEA